MVADMVVHLRRVDMLTRPGDSIQVEFLTKFHSAFAALLDAFEYAVDVGDDRWNFAVLIRDLQATGLNESDLRWLVRKGYVQHAREATVPGANERQFQPTGAMTFVRRSCFVLTDVGVDQARLQNLMSRQLAFKKRSLQSRQDSESISAGSHLPERVKENFATCIHWDAKQRKLDVLGQVVKRFRWQAPNQEIVLSAFQEEGWPLRIDDPLPPQPEQDSKRRLSDTIKCLNRKQINPLIHFHGDGTGEGVVWELLDH